MPRPISGHYRVREDILRELEDWLVTRRPFGGGERRLGSRMVFGEWPAPEGSSYTKFEAAPTKRFILTKILEEKVNKGELSGTT